MLYRIMEAYLKDYLKSDNNKVLLVAKARQIGKSYIIRKVGKVLFDNFIELNMVTDKLVTKENIKIINQKIILAVNQIHLKILQIDIQIEVKKRQTQNHQEILVKEILIRDVQLINI